MRGGVKGPPELGLLVESRASEIRRFRVGRQGGEDEEPGVPDRGVANSTSRGAMLAASTMLWRRLDGALLLRQPPCQGAPEKEGLSPADRGGCSGPESPSQRSEGDWLPGITWPDS